jgi:glycosyltransferase involved in cell wall biosynthesis
MKPAYSFIIPVFNRPIEIDEILESLSNQTFKDFEVLIIEDGSTLKCNEVVNKYESKLNIRYFFKENSGQGFSRNYGFERSNSDYFIQLDSDAIVPENYLEIVDYQLKKRNLDAFGGPDKAHESFTNIQKAINYSMTSFFTTGGIRGKAKNAGGQFHPRSFNFGISRAVFEITKGYNWTRKAEDIEFSIRILEAGFKVELIEEAFIYHKRRTSFSQFFKQLEFFGRGRINLSRFFPKELKIVHFFPICFLISLISIPVLFLFNKTLFQLALVGFAVYFLAIFIDSLKENKSIKVALLSVLACIIQLSAYGLGFIKEQIGI